MSILYGPNFRNFSAQSSGFEELVNGGFENGGYFQPSSTEMESMFARFVGSDGSDAADPQKEMRHEPVKQEERLELKQELPYIPVQDDSCSTVNAESNLFGDVAFHNPGRAMGTGNISNLIRQHSSPAGFLSSIPVENGFVAANGESSRSRGLNGQINFTSDNSWREVSFNNLKRMREDGGTLFSGLSSMDSQTENKRNHLGGLIHHLSLPKTSNEMAAVEKILHFQDAAIPCKIRAKRGFATHPRSIAERNRRGRISERMRKLQDLFPNLDKQANTSDMLDLALGQLKTSKNKLRHSRRVRPSAHARVREKSVRISFWDCW